MKHITEIIAEHLQDTHTQCIIMMGGPGAGKTHFMNHNLRRFLQDPSLQFVRLDSDHNLEKYQREHAKDVGLNLLKTISERAVSAFDNAKQAFANAINEIQVESDKACRAGGSPTTDFSQIKFNFIKPWTRRWDNAQESQRGKVENEFIEAFIDEYWKAVFASDFSVRKFSKVEYKGDLVKKLKPVLTSDVNDDNENGASYVGEQNACVAITGDDMSKFDEIINNLPEDVVVQVIYLDVPEEVSVRNDAGRPRSLGREFIHNKLTDIHKTFEEIVSDFDSTRIYKLHVMNADHVEDYLSGKTKDLLWEETKTYINKRMIRSMSTR